MDPRFSEVTEIHTRILRLALGLPESRAYWANVDPSIPVAQRASIAFEQRWFGAKSLERVRTLIAYLSARYDAFPEALSVLRRWRDMDPGTRQVICHWHMQLSDPLYRRFTGEYLVSRRNAPVSTVDRDVVLDWVQRVEPGRWAPATCIQFSSKLLGAAWEAGLTSSNRPGPRKLLYPHVSDHALGYLLQLLRETRFQGELLANPYLASVGLTGSELDGRLRALPGLLFRRMGDLSELHWSAADLTSWAEASL